MGLIDYIFGKKRVTEATENYQQYPAFKTLTDYCPVFTSYNGALFEQELTRAAIERFATACCKLKPELVGNPSLAMSRMVTTKPNKYQTWPAFLSRLATVYECDSTAFVVPVFKGNTDEIVGVQAIKCEYAEILEHAGEPWVRFHFAAGDVAVCELKYVSILAKFQYASDFFGEPNCLDQTMQLIHSQAEAQKAAIEAGAKIRFVAGVGGQMREEDMRKKRDRFADDNFGPNNTSGLMIYDTTFHDVTQIKPYSWTIDPDEMAQIKSNVFTYFGINEDILQNKYSEDVWGAWYEGKIEPFAVKLGESLTNMLFSERMQQQSGTRLMFSSNRLEYASNASKRNMVSDMIDRSIMTPNEAREVLQLAPREGGDDFVIRGEYIGADAISTKVSASATTEEDRDLGGDDDIYKDSDGHNQEDF